MPVEPSTDEDTGVSWIPKREHNIEQVWLESLVTLTREVEHAKLEMATAFTFGIDKRNNRIRFVEHSARVTMLTDRLAVSLKITDEGRRDLHSAAQLHEIGMMGVPVELVENPGRLDREGVQKIRAQAMISGEIARATQSPRTVRLIEEQYTDFAQIRKRFPHESLDVLLAGILHVADAFDAITHPRPYQARIPRTDRMRKISAGRGTAFHPDVVQTLIELDLEELRGL